MRKAAGPPSGVAEYIASQPRGVRGALRHVRRLIRAAMPGAEEGISYGMPTYRLAGKAVVYFAGWKAHYSLYPVTAELVEALPEIGAYELSRGTVRFLYSEPVPARLVRAIARLLAQRAHGRVPARAGTRSGRPAGARGVRRHPRGRVRAPHEAWLRRGTGGRSRGSR